MDGKRLRRPRACIVGIWTIAWGIMAGASGARGALASPRADDGGADRTEPASVDAGVEKPWPSEPLSNGVPIGNPGDVAGQPPNDSCANASVVTDGTHPIDTNGASTDGPELLQPACHVSGYNQVNADIWYRYNGTCTGDLTVSLCTSLFDTKLAVYSGSRCPTIPSETACNDDFESCDEQSQVTLEVVQGNGYLIRVGGFFNSQGTGTMSIACQPDTTSNGACCDGTTCLGTMTQPACNVLEGSWHIGTDCLTFDCPPPNDECTNAIALTTEVPFDGATVGATGKLTSSCAENDGRDVWFKWTADCLGEATFSVCGPNVDFDTSLAVLDGCGGTELACDDDGCAPGSKIPLRVTPGETFYLRVAGRQGAVGNFSILVESCASACCSVSGLCALRKPNVCTSVGGTPQAPGSVCLGDSNFNNRDDVCEPDPWVFKDHNGAAEGGYLPDFDQQQDFDNLDADGDPATGIDPNYGGPVAVADSLWWFDRRYPSLDVVSAGVPPGDLIEDLATRMGTNGTAQHPSPNGHTGPYVGTFLDDLQSGVDSYLGDRGLNHVLLWRSESAPTFDLVAAEVLQSNDVILGIGFYEVQSVDTIPGTGFVVHWSRLGGNYLAVAGVDTTNRRVVLSDPDGDFVEEELPGFVRGGDHDHDADADPGTAMVFRHPDYEHTRHDDETFASQDAHFAKRSFAPNSQWVLAPVRNGLLYGNLQAPFHSTSPSDAGTTLVTNTFLSQNNYLNPVPGHTYTGVEWATIVSPAGNQACCRLNATCADVPPVDCIAQGHQPQGFGTVCAGDGNANGMDDFCEPCPVATIAAAFPQNGTIDARQPHGPGTALPRQGIGAPGEPGSTREPIRIQLSPQAANAARCFRLCETRTMPAGGPNSITSVTPLGSGVYELVLDYAIAADGVTTIRYRGDGSFVSYIAHPGNVDGSNVTNVNDVTAMIQCCLRQQCSAAWGLYSCDVDHSGAVAAPDMLRLIDLLQAEAFYPISLNSPLPVNTACP